MFEVTLLTTRDEKQWLEILGRFELKDPHYLPGYLEIYEKESNRESFMHFGGQGMLFVYGDSRNFIIYPFFKRSLSHLPFSDSDVKDLYDIISPYGYGGPLAQIEDETISEELWRGLFERFDDFCKESNIVSEFCRLHPIFENHRPVANFSRGVTQRLGRIVYIDLSSSEEEILAAMQKKRRRHVQRASENPDLGFCLEKEEEHCRCFFNLYTETMRRRRAHKKHFFPRGFFDAAFRTLGEHIMCAHIQYKGDIISGLLLLRYGDLVYSWLSANEPEYDLLHPNDLLFYRSFLESKKAGSRYFVLGGGVSSKEDSLFTYKAYFSSTFKDFYVYKRIHLKKEYERLVELQGYTGEMREDFFPQYRLHEAVTEGGQPLQGMEGENEQTEWMVKIA